MNTKETHKEDLSVDHATLIATVDCPDSVLDPATYTLLKKMAIVSAHKFQTAQTSVIPFFRDTPVRP